METDFYIKLKNILLKYENLPEQDTESLIILDAARRHLDLLEKTKAYPLGTLAKKKGNKGQWHGKVVGFYFTDITPVGYAIESMLEEGSVQIYPETALEYWDYENET